MDDHVSKTCPTCGQRIVSREESDRIMAAIAAEARRLDTERDQARTGQAAGTP